MVTWNLIPHVITTLFPASFGYLGAETMFFFSVHRCKK